MQAVPENKSRRVIVVSLACAALVAAAVLLVLQVTKWQAEPGTPIAENAPAAKPAPGPIATPVLGPAQGAASAGGAVVPPTESNAPSPQNRAGGRMVPPDATK